MERNIYLPITENTQTSKINKTKEKKAVPSLRRKRKKKKKKKKKKKNLKRVRMHKTDIAFIRVGVVVEMGDHFENQSIKGSSRMERGEFEISQLY
jgi:hypothetical protein